MILGLEGWASAVLIRKIRWGWHPRAETCRWSILVINCILLSTFLVDILIILICLFLFPSLPVSSSLTFSTYFILSNCLFFLFFHFLLISIFIFLFRCLYFLFSLLGPPKIMDLFYSPFEVFSLLGKDALSLGEQFPVFRSIFVSSSSESSNLAFSSLSV